MRTFHRQGNQPYQQRRSIVRLFLERSFGPGDGLLELTKEKVRKRETRVYIPGFAIPWAELHRPFIVSNGLLVPAGHPGHMAADTPRRDVIGVERQRTLDVRQRLFRSGAE